MLGPESPELAAIYRRLDGPGEPCRRCGAFWRYVASMDGSHFAEKTHRGVCGDTRSGAWVNL